MADTDNDMSSGDMKVSAGSGDMKVSAGSGDMKVTAGSGNVFADLGVAEPDEGLAKAQLASHIRAVIGRRKLTQGGAADVMGLDQPKVSALMNGRLTGFSSDRLLRCLTALGLSVDIMVHGDGTPGSRGRVRVIENAV